MLFPHVFCGKATAGFSRINKCPSEVHPPPTSSESNSLFSTGNFARISTTEMDSPPKQF